VATTAQPCHRNGPRVVNARLQVGWAAGWQQPRGGQHDQLAGQQLPPGQQPQEDQGFAGGPLDGNEDPGQREPGCRRDQGGGGVPAVAARRDQPVDDRAGGQRGGECGLASTPTAAPAPAIAAQVPSARVRWGLWKVVVMIASADGDSSAAPMPWPARAATRIAPPWARPEISDATVNRHTCG
jgi:hypothetical protein